jgi:hypothetical protein
MQAIPAALQAVGQIFAGDSERRSLNYQADIAQQNAKIAAAQGNAAEEQQRRISRMRLGEQRAAAAQSGFDPSSGSFAELQAESAANAELDALTTRYSSTMQSMSLENEARGLRANAKTANMQGYLNAAGTLSGAYAKYGTGSVMPSYNYNGDASGMKYSRSGTEIRARR